MHGGCPPRSIVARTRRSTKRAARSGKTEREEEGQWEQAVAPVASVTRCSGEKQLGLPFYRPEKGTGRRAVSPVHLLAINGVAVAP